MKIAELKNRQNYTYCIDGQWTVYHAELDNRTVAMIDYATLKVWVR